MEGFLKPFKEMLVRPPRAIYDEDDLGPKYFQIGNKNYKRKDLKVKNSKL